MFILFYSGNEIGLVGSTELGKGISELINI
jgi:hypothetical protein